MTTIEEVERRKYKRFKVKKGAFAILWPHSKKIGEIIDISRSGLAFCYFADENLPDESIAVDIFWHDHSFHLDNIPCKTVYENEIADEPPSTHATMKRIGVQFEDVIASKSSQLNHFIRNYTIGEA